MIKEASLENIEDIYELGKKIEINFKNLYNLKEELENVNKKYYLFFENEKVVGFINISITEEDVEVINIIVTERYRKKNIGNKLLNYVISNYKQKIFLEVNVNNYGAIALYKKNNFEVINTRKGYYKGVDALVMVRK